MASRYLPATTTSEVRQDWPLHPVWDNNLTLQLAEHKKKKTNNEYVKREFQINFKKYEKRGERKKKMLRVLYSFHT